MLNVNLLWARLRCASMDPWMQQPLQVSASEDR
jgi:hypothetical protein